VVKTSRIWFGALYPLSVMSWPKLIHAAVMWSLSGS